MSRLKLNNRDVTYFSYISETLKIIANNIIGIMTNEGVRSVEKSVLELFVHEEDDEKPQETADSIINRIKNGLNSL